MASDGIGLSFVHRFTQYSDVMIAVGVVAILGVMIIPMPPLLMDLLLAVNITMALIILLVTMYTREPLEFSIFPGLLLIVTLFRLSLNIASTRLILGEAYAGRIIEAFGNFVVKGNYVVGFVIFLILVVINFVVITKGSGRVAEVAARFTLDAMPGKQMSIDADLNAGLIDDAEARKRRAKVAREADFYGAMDGASKFVRGDAIAGLVITTLNIVGGFIIGVAQKRMGFSQALETYTLLTVGDGLVSQIPALVISTSAGIIVTHTASESNLGHDVTTQLLSQPRAILVASGVLLFLGIVPGMPTVPFLVLAAATGVFGYTLREEQKKPVEGEEVPKEEETPPTAEEDIEAYLQVDPLELEIGYGLIPLVDAEHGGDLLGRITHIRKECAMELGIVIPPIRIRDNVQLDAHTYVIKIRGEEVSRGELKMGYYMALNPGTVEEEVEGIQTIEPAFGLEALWISERQREKAELAGYTVVEAPAVLATHLMEVLKSNAHRILSREDVQRLLEIVKQDQPTLVDELVPNLMTVGGVEKVLQRLLWERVPIRDLTTILETLADYAGMTKDTGALTEYVRQALSRTIVRAYQDEEGTLYVLVLDPEIERVVSEAIGPMQTSGTGSGALPIPPQVLQGLYSALETQVEAMRDRGRQPIVLCTPTVRGAFKQLMDEGFPGLVVLSYSEIPPGVEVQSVGVVRMSNAS